MSSTARLLAFAVALLAVFAVAYGVGTAIGPLGGDSGDGADAPHVAVLTEVTR